MQKYEFASLPPGLEWQSQLSHQTRELPSPLWCLQVVREAFGKVLDW